jgi:hypothetical protein
MGLLVMVKWQGVGVHVLGISLWQGKLYLLRRGEDMRPNMKLH